MEEDPELERIKRKMLMKMQGEGKNAAQKRFDITILDSNNFQQTITSGKPVLVDYYADWCGPCRFMEPVFEKVASKYAGKVVFARINVDQNPQIASEYGVFSIPTFILFDGGKPVNRVVGAVPENTLTELVTKTVGS
ncbi:MAG: thioredoxin [Candidatus Bathyarchaeia archaeon]